MDGTNGGQVGDLGPGYIVDQRHRHSIALSHFTVERAAIGSGCKSEGLAVGPVGKTGPQGIQGPTGERGQIGPYGGDKGAVGPAGATGAQGKKGDAGPKGASGADGSQGIQGGQGDEGPQGVKGTEGTNIGARMGFFRSPKTAPYHHLSYYPYSGSHQKGEAGIWRGSVIAKADLLWSKIETFGNYPTHIEAMEVFGEDSVNKQAEFGYFTDSHNPLLGDESVVKKFGVAYNKIAFPKGGYYNITVNARFNHYCDHDKCTPNLNFCVKLVQDINPSDHFTFPLLETGFHWREQKNNVFQIACKRGRT
ncbi:MAG TPA: collagen-like protein, partial [Flavobacteriales bacterium]|nr:collagen-like protein [Flavobacteriales bacterium]